MLIQISSLNETGGTIVFTYLMLKLIKSNVEQEPEKKFESENVQEVVEENITHSNSESSDKSEKSKRKRNKKKESEGSAENMKIPRPRPNFFIGIQVSNKGIHEKVKKMQETIIEKNPMLYSALVPVSTLHVTLAVTHLANETAIKTLKEKLEEWSDKNLHLYTKDPIVLTFSGIKTFDDIVAYVDLEKCENYTKISGLSQAMTDLLSSAGFASDEKSFKPHLTILKLSKNYNLLKSRKYFKKDFQLMKKCKDQFGKQEVKHLQLLSMNEPKDKSGYYKCLHQIKLSDPEVDVDHSMCCSPIPEPKITK